MFIQKRKRAVGIGIMLVLTTFVGMTANVSAEDLIADAGGPYETYECEEIILDASGSHGGEGTLEYRWDFGDDWTEWSSGYEYSTRWLDNGIFSISLQVSDGMTYAKDTTTVNVLNRAPQNLTIEGPEEEVDVGDEITLDIRFFDGSADPRGFVCSMDTYTVTFHWDDDTSDSFMLGPEDVVEFGDFEKYFVQQAVHTYYETGTYDVMIVIKDDDDGELIGNWMIFVNGYIPILVVDAGEDAIIDEGSMFLSAGSLSDTINMYTAQVDYGDGTDVEELLLNPGNTFELQHQYGDNGVYSVVVTAFNEGEEWGSDEVIVTVYNVAPIIESFIGSSPDPVQLGTPYLITSVFSDPGYLDTHVATIDWGDNQTTSINILDGSYVVLGSHAYAAAGVYRITLTVTDDDGDSDTEVLENYVVVYDPSAGFVTGGGWIIAQPESYPANPTLTGKATFGFVSKYKKGQSTPSGNTEFQFHAAGMNFHSHTYEWLVIAGSKAMYKGVGTINGAGNYGFKLTAIDGQIKDGGGVDKFRIKIWDEDNNIVFDNNLGLPDDNDPVTALCGGQITIHKN